MKKKPTEITFVYCRVCELSKNARCLWIVLLRVKPKGYKRGCCLLQGIQGGGGALTLFEYPDRIVQLPFRVSSSLFHRSAPPFLSSYLVKANWLPKSPELPFIGLVSVEKFNAFPACPAAPVPAPAAATTPVPEGPVGKGLPIVGVGWSPSAGRKPSMGFEGGIGTCWGAEGRRETTPPGREGGPER